MVQSCGGREKDRPWRGAFYRESKGGVHRIGLFRANGKRALDIVVFFMDNLNI